MKEKRHDASETRREAAERKVADGKDRLAKYRAALDAAPARC